MRRALLCLNISCLIAMATVLCFLKPAMGEDSIFDPDGGGSGSPPAQSPKVPAPVKPQPPKQDPKPTPPPKVEPSPKVPPKVPPKVAVARPRLAVPAEADLAQAQAALRERLKADYANRDRAGAEALVKKLFQEADQNTGGAVGRFAGLCEARDVALRIGDLSLAQTAVSRIAQGYRVSRERMSLDVLDAAYKSGITSPAEATDSYLLLTDELLRQDDYDGAYKAISKAAASAARAKIPALVTRAKLQTRNIAELKRQRDAADAARATLLLKPDDPELNLVVGRYLCSVKDQWSEGLKCLAKVSDPESQKLAEMDLSTPATPDAMCALAARWWSFGQRKTDALPTADAHRRAGFWYVRAFPGLSGLAKTAAQARIAELFAGLQFENVGICNYLSGDDATGTSPALYGLSDPAVPDELIVRPESRRIHIFGAKESASISIAGGSVNRYGKAVLIPKMRWGGGNISTGITPSAGSTIRYEVLIVNQAGGIATQPIEFSGSAPTRWSISEEGDQVRLTVFGGDATLASLSVPSNEFKSFGFAVTCVTPKEKADLDITLGAPSK